MTIEEISPELFTWELYNYSGTWGLEDACYCADSFGYCDASRLLFRPRKDQFALMVYWPNGKRCWFHVTEKLLSLVKKRCGNGGAK